MRDLWVVACGASDVLWNCDHGDELVAAVVATPEHYAPSPRASPAATRKDLYLNIDQKLALQAMFARFEEVADECLGSRASCSAAAARSTSSTPAPSSWLPATGVVVDTTRGADFGRLVKGPDEVAAADAPRGVKKILRKATAGDLDAVASHRSAELEAKARLPRARRRARAST